MKPIREERDKKERTKGEGFYLRRENPTFGTNGKPTIYKYISFIVEAD